LIFRFCQLYFLPVAALKCAATSCIIVELLDVLSHVMWPICNLSVSARSHTISIMTPASLPCGRCRPVW
jgi:hypothetical protein